MARWEWRAKVCGCAGALLFVAGLLALAGCSRAPALLAVGFGLVLAGLAVGVAWAWCLEMAEEEKEAASWQAEEVLARQ